VGVCDFWNYSIPWSNAANKEISEIVSRLMLRYFFLMFEGGKGESLIAMVV
jgi:hypothetical protein